MSSYITSKYSTPQYDDDYTRIEEFKDTYKNSDIIWLELVYYIHRDHFRSRKNQPLNPNVRAENNNLILKNANIDFSKNYFLVEDSYEPALDSGRILRVTELYGYIPIGGFKAYGRQAVRKFGKNDERDTTVYNATWIASDYLRKRITVAITNSENIKVGDKIIFNTTKTLKQSVSSNVVMFTYFTKNPTTVLEKNSNHILLEDVECEITIYYSGIEGNTDSLTWSLINVFSYMQHSILDSHFVGENQFARLARESTARQIMRKYESTIVLTLGLPEETEEFEVLKPLSPRGEETDIITQYTSPNIWEYEWNVANGSSYIIQEVIPTPYKGDVYIMEIRRVKYEPI